MNREFFKFFGIRKKLIIYFLFIILFLSSISLFSYYSADVVLNNTNTIIKDYIYINDVKNTVNSLITELEKYLTTASSESLLRYYDYYNRLQVISREIPRTLDYNEDKLILKDIGNMLDELLSETDKAVLAKRGRISSRYIANFERVTEIGEYINKYNNKLLDNTLKGGTERYQNINSNMRFIIILTFFAIIVSVIVTLYIAASATYRLIKPISELSKYAERITEGDLEVKLTQTHTGDETDILTGAFINMVESIKDYISELKKQAEMENKLKEQELQNLKMGSLLKEAELKYLQSQINPHFLFNTLNAAAQLSTIEGADKTSEFIENIAQLFRYNLKNIDDLVSLRDEIEHVINYIQILKMRFGNRIDFYTDIDELALDTKIPRITLQPIVENAYIHGLQNLERKGEIHLNVKAELDYVLIDIIDNGTGMDKECINAIICSNKDEEIAKKHVTGIGMKNVLERLELLFNIKDRSELISIESKIDEGTKVTLKIPRFNVGQGGLKVC